MSKVTFVLDKSMHGVRIKFQLTPLSGEVLQYQSADTMNDARIDISAGSLWVSGQLAFSDIKAFSPLASNYNSQNLKSM